MTEIRVFCDRCGERVCQDRTLLKVATGPERVKRTEIDLCVDCLAVVVATIDHRAEDVTAPSPRKRVARDKPNGLPKATAAR